MSETKLWPYVYVNPDGTVVPRSELSDGVQTFYPAEVPLLQKTYVDDFTALQLGLWMILDGLTFTTIDRRALVTSGRIESNTFRFTRIFLDWPESEDDAVPIPSATIYAPTEQSLELSGPLSGATLLEESENVYAPGTALKKLYEISARISVSFWVADKDERSAIRKGLVEAFHEPGDARSGRRVVVPWYFDRVARFDLVGISYDDTPDNARSNTWPLTATFEADTEAVALVAAPECIRPPRFDVSTS